MHEFDMIGVAGIMGLSFLLMMSLIMLAAFAFWIWALVDILKNEFTGSNKLMAPSGHYGPPARNDPLLVYRPGAENTGN